MSRLRRLVRREDGAAAVEFALIGLLLITVSVGTIEVGRALFLFNELAHVADRAERLILIAPPSGISDTELVSQVKEEFLVGLSPDLLDVKPDKTTIDGISFRTLVIEYPFTFLIPGLTDSSLTLKTERRVPAGT